MARTKAAPKGKTVNGRTRGKAASKSKWTPEKLEQIPAPYRSCLGAFYYMVRTGRRWVRRIPFSSLYGQVSYRHGYGVDETIRIADELVRAGFIEGPDELDTFAPTADGDELVQALLAYDESETPFIPPFPAIAE